MRTLKWHQKPLAIILFSVFIFPMGVVLIWKQSTWVRKRKVSFTVLFTFVFVFVFVVPISIVTSPKTTSTMQEHVINSPETSQEEAFRSAVLVASEASDFIKLVQVIASFEELGEYKNSREYLENCFKRIVGLTDSMSDNEIYEMVKSAYRNGCFNEANVLIKLLPVDFGGYGEVNSPIDPGVTQQYQIDFYRAACSSFVNFINGDWDMAAQDILFFNNIVSYDYPTEFADDTKRAFRFIEGTPNYRLIETRYTTGIGLRSAEMYFHDFYYNCSEAYFNQKINSGEVKNGFSAFPYESDGRLQSGWDKFYYERRDLLIEKINQLGIADYYIRTDNSTNPVAVSGSGVYITVSDASGRHIDEPSFGPSPGRPSLAYTIPSNYYAATPEEVRYIVAVTDVSHEMTARYRGSNIRGYSTSARVTIKDTVTGEIMYSGYYTGSPPYATSSTEDVYAVVNFSSFISDCMSILCEIFPVLADDYLSYRK